jgi:hypothetical protein
MNNNKSDWEKLKNADWSKPIVYGLIGLNGYIWGIFGGQYLFQPTNAVIKDVNKDGIEDIVTYRNNKRSDTFIGVRDSSKTITYVEADRLYKQRLDSLEKTHEKNKLETENNYNQQKADLEKIIER